jgi:hypothetical protein
VITVDDVWSPPCRTTGDGENQHRTPTTRPRRTAPVVPHPTSTNRHPTRTPPPRPGPPR